MQLNIIDWREFKISEILKRVKIKSISLEKRKFNNGHINVIGNSRSNNGVISKLHINDNIYIHKGNVLSYGAKGGLFFYQKDEWASTDHVHMFECNNLNENIGLFICTIINKIIYKKGGWSSSLESSILNENIKLPVDENGNPNWSYMNEYIVSLRERENFELALSITNQKFELNFCKWKEFKISEIFEVAKTKNSSKINDSGNVPYISRKENNNGVAMLKNVPISLIEQSSITIHCEWKRNFVSFYHDNPYCADGKIVKLSNENLNKYNALFLTTILNKTKAIDYKLETIKNITIKIPTNNLGKPDFEYMEKYIKSLKYSKYI